jgi:hypothetical protein
MVGRGGRSRGCFNCRKRHLKCGKTGMICGALHTDIIEMKRNPNASDAREMVTHAAAIRRIRLSSPRTRLAGPKDHKRPSGDHRPIGCLPV